jgi:ubiquinone/menaquinone biosynthesis C-methylase UbiE|tara:strand:+ start:151 stop:918 length:768 start_codon:yes stop_codon:yes gene_type:complete
MYETEQEIKESYQREKLVSSYDNDRFKLFGYKLGHIEEIDYINQAIKKSSSKNILEVAIGTGRISKNLKYFNKATGVDTSPTMLSYAKKQINNSKWTLKKGDMFKLTGSFDIVISFRLIRHFHSKDRKRAYDSIKKVLKKDGLMVIDALNKDRSLVAKLIDNLKYKVVGSRGSVYDIYYTKKSLVKELKSNGFDIVSIKGVNNMNILLFLFSLISRIGFIRVILDKILLKPILGLDKMFYKSKHPFSWVVIAKKK